MVEWSEVPPLDPALDAVQRRTADIIAFIDSSAAAFHTAYRTTNLEEEKPMFCAKWVELKFVADRLRRHYVISEPKKGDDR